MREALFHGMTAVRQAVGWIIIVCAVPFTPGKLKHQAVFGTRLTVEPVEAGNWF
jgi:hypothetical protein